jgi:hypothetical protein
MTRYILFFSGDAPKQSDLDIIGNTPGVQVIEKTSSRAFLVDVSELGLKQLRSHLKGWVINSETIYSNPRRPHHTAQRKSKLP